jgi:uncharacterized phage-associated protein
LKLNKLVYLTFAVGYAYYNRELFEDKIEAWYLGPVIPNVYHNYKKYENSNIPKEHNKNKGFDSETMEILNIISNSCGEMSGIDLKNKLHKKNTAWSKNYKKGVKNIIINKADIKNELPNFKNNIPTAETIEAVLEEPKEFFTNIEDFKKALEV